VNKDLIKSILILLIALVMAYGGVALSRYADKDDSPGGMVIGWAVVAGAVLIGVKALQRRNSA
jgi:hypothetical protein